MKPVTTLLRAVATLACALLLCGQPASAQTATYVSSTVTSAAGGSTTLALTAASVTAGNLMVLHLGWQFTADFTISSLSDSACSAWTHSTQHTGVNSFGMQVWICVATSTQAADVITVHFSATSGGADHVWAIEDQYSGWNSTTIDIDTSGMSTSGGSATSGSFTTTSAGELIVGAIWSGPATAGDVHPVSSTIAGSSGSTAFNGTSDSMGSAYRQLSSIVTTQTAVLSVTGVNQDNDMNVIGIVAPAAGTPGCKNGLLLNRVGCVQ